MRNLSTQFPGAGFAREMVADDAKMYEAFDDRASLAFLHLLLVLRADILR
ncbi:hypothetical protein [Lysobacter sp. CFH 32150]|nr:hypothetical protein [Lysobacter sp. CFH 32150]MCI4568014.1 hypothetical protein [Lysobacter sp. CFH 32150]